MDLIKFDPSLEQLHAIIASTTSITATDLSDTAQLAIVKSNRIQLRDARIAIEKKGKSMREEALKYQKDVIAREKELLAIITPEEDRLKAIEDEAKLIKERAARVALLPMRREQLNGLEEQPSLDGFLLDMDNDEFITYLNTKKAEKLDRDMAELKAREAAIADKERIAQVEEAARVAEQNRLEILHRADAAALEKKNAYEKQQIELEAQKKIDEANAELAKNIAQEATTKREAEAREQQLKDDQEKREKQKRYKTWLVKIGYTETEHGSWYFDTKADVTNAYKLISSFKGI